jgi:hypothetical protein
VLSVLCVSGLAARSADTPAPRLFDLPRPQLRPLSPQQLARAPAKNAVPRLEEIALQTKTSSDLGLRVQRHEAMNGSPLLIQRPANRDTSSFRRTLDSFLPPGGAFLGKNPNALSSPLDRAEYWTK